MIARDWIESHRNDPVHSDIAGHFDTLTRYARCSRSVLELGTHDGSSGMAFIAGQPESLVTVDVQRVEGAIERLERAAKVAGVEFRFVHTGSVEWGKPFRCFENEVNGGPAMMPDLLFIDTQHTYDQCLAELYLYAPMIQRYILLHDTDTYGEQGDQPETAGLWTAISEFMRSREGAKWRLSEHHAHTSGLTVLVRVSG